VGDVMAELTSVVARQGKEWSRRYRHRTPGYCGGWSSSMTTATGRARPSGVVREVADVEVRLQVKGEVEGSTESTGHGGVLSRSGTSSCVSWRAWASLGASVHVSFWPVATSTWSRACRGSFRRVKGSRLTR
jgi:hypothetical protein